MTRCYGCCFCFIQTILLFCQFVLAVGLDKRKFHLVGLSMDGFVAGVFATKYPSLLSSLVLMCPAGINAPRISDFLMEIASGGKNYLLPKNPEDFRFMMKKVSHRNVFMPFFVVKIICETRKQAHDFYEKGKKEYYHSNGNSQFFASGRKFFFVVRGSLALGSLLRVVK